MKAHFVTCATSEDKDHPELLCSKGPDVQSIVSLMSSLVVKMLTALVSTIS